MTTIEKIEKGVIISIIISIIIYFIFFQNSDLNKVKESISNIGPITIIILLSLTLMNNIFRFIRWHLLLMNAKVDISLTNSFKSFSSSLALTMTPGKAGELLKASIVRKYSNVSRLKLIPIIILERVFDLAGFAVILLLAITFSSFGEYTQRSIVISTMVIAIVFSVFLLLKTKKTKRFVSKIIDRIPLLKKRKRLLLDILNDYSKLSIANILTYVAISIVGWSFEIVEFYIALNTLGAKISIFESGFVFGFSSLGGSLVPTPGGVGGFEGVSFFLMTNLLSISPAIATTATILIRFTTIWFVVFMGIVSYLNYIKQ